MGNYLETADENQRQAHEILRSLGIVAAWESVGARVEIVGSLRSGLLMKHRDIDLHIYSPTLDITRSFKALEKIAADPRIRRVEYANLADAPDRCLEWHAWYAEEEGAPQWQIDMIHMAEGSEWDGYFEKVADRIAAKLTEQSRTAILRLKYETPDEEHIPGLAYYMAVLQDGVTTYDDFRQWLRDHPLEGIVEWMP